MKEYPKITNVYMRDPETKFKTLIEGKFAKPEFECLAEARWRFHEKVDGTNIRIMWDENSVKFGGRTDRAQIPAHLLEVLQEKFYAGAMSEIFHNPVCLYGEGYGNKIQAIGSSYNPDGVDFALFDVLVGDVWLDQPDVKNIADILQVTYPSEFGIGNLYDAVEICRQGFKSELNADVDAEGLICRPLVELYHRKGHRIITKIKCKDFN